MNDCRPTAFPRGAHAPFRRALGCGTTPLPDAVYPGLAVIAAINPTCQSGWRRSRSTARQIAVLFRGLLGRALLVRFRVAARAGGEPNGHKAKGRPEAATCFGQPEGPLLVSFIADRSIGADDRGV
jgi:hypothetical protein